MAKVTQAGEALNGKKGTALGEDPTNDAEAPLTTSLPYVASITLEGTSALLFHRWSNEDVAAKGAAAKNSAAKKTDNVEAYVARCDDGTIGIPGEYLRQSLIGAARYRQDPRSPRKSAMDLFKAAIVSLTECASLGKAEWDYLDRRRVTVQRNGITRVRPAFLAGWQAEFELMCNLPEYLPAPSLLDALVAAGKFVGVGDFRPSYGRFAVVRFDVGLAT